MNRAQRRREKGMRLVFDSESEKALALNYVTTKIREAKKAGTQLELSEIEFCEIIKNYCEKKEGNAK